MSLLSSTFGDFCHPLPSVSNSMSQEAPYGRKRRKGDGYVDEVNAYVVLQVRRDATPSEIREAYRRLALWHHPGRSRDICEEELERRSEIFFRLGASYETLAVRETRQMYDILLQDQIEQMENREPWTETTTPLGSAAVNSSCVPVCSCTCMLDGNDDIPSLMTSESNNKPELQREDSDLDDVSSHGPLFLLLEARNHLPFTDSYDLFDGVFGSNIYPRMPDCSTQPISLHRKALTPAWTGETKVLRNGNLLSKTSRVLHTRKLTRTELISKGPDGAKCLHVTVKSEDFGEDGFPETIRRPANSTPDGSQESGSFCCGFLFMD
mmetsp:Transcript_13486/g.19885  ORF Transcript_13486/g.19885 Transcript_13486/m.19885 type:complete len:323 (-) Transcript_13486:33-1001(-)